MVYIIIPLFNVAIFHVCNEMNIVLTALLCIIMPYIYAV